MALEVFNRYEHKYITDSKTYEAVLGVIGEYMEPDIYNADGKPYTIANIYYDTEDDILIRRSLSKPDYKEKLRLRSYGVPDGSMPVYLEIKKKCGGMVNKRRTSLRLKEAYEFAKTGIAPEYKEYMNEQVIREIEYFLKIYDLRPKVYIAYDRVAYFGRDDSDLRVSFDMNIRTRRYGLALEHGTAGIPLMDEGLYLMEIKTAGAMPLWLAQMLSRYRIRRTSFSKYGTEYKRFIKEGEPAAVKAM